MYKGITPGADLSVALNAYYVSALRDASPSGALMDKPGTFCGKHCLSYYEILLSNYYLVKKTDSIKSPKCKYSALPNSCKMNRFGKTGRFVAELCMFSNGEIVYSEFSTAQGFRLLQ